jgi:large repetitive protein
MRIFLRIIMLILISISTNLSFANNSNNYKTEFLNFDNTNSKNTILQINQDTAKASSLSKATPSIITTCVNTSVTLTNTALPNNGHGCSNIANYVWNFGDGTTAVSTQLTSPQSKTHTYSQPGLYTVTLTSQNGCGAITNSLQICVEPPPVPVFSLDVNQGCAPLTVQTTNTTNTATICSTINYSWAVTYDAGDCGTTGSYSYSNGSNSTSANPTFQFTSPGIYTIKLSVTNFCGTYFSTQTVVVKRPPVVSIDNIPDFCGTATLNPTATVKSCSQLNALSYAWSFPGGSPAFSTNANPIDIYYSTPGQYSVLLNVTNECGVSVTDTKIFTIKKAPKVINTPLDQTVCSGIPTSQVNLIADMPGTTFSWTATATPGVSGFNAAGITDFLPAQTIVTTSTTAGTVTYAIIPSLNGCTGPVTNYTVTVNPSPIITQQPVSSSVCKDGIPTDLTVAVTVLADTPIYQWYSYTGSNPAAIISGATNPAYTPPTNTVGSTNYYCIISFSSGVCAHLTSDTVTVTVSPPVIISVQPTPNQDVCVGGASSLLSVNYSGGIGAVSYQWYLNTVNLNVGGTAITGETNSSFTPPGFNTAGQYYYYVTVTSPVNNCGSAISDVAHVNVLPDPLVTTQPINSQSVCQGQAPLPLSMTVSGGVGTYTYQWYQNAANSIIGGTPISGATNDTYVPVTSTIGTVYYYCIAQNVAGCNTTTNTAEVIVNPAPTFVQQPIASDVCVGGVPAQLLITYNAGIYGSPTIEWFRNSVDDTNTGTLIPGETTATYDPPAAVVGKTYYYCVLTFPLGTCNVIKSTTALVSVSAIPTISIQPMVTQKICAGNSIASPLTVAYKDGAGVPTYNWYYSTSNSYSGTLIVGANAATYMPPVFATAGSYYYYAIISLSGSHCGSTTSTIAQIVVDPTPVVSHQSVPAQAVCINTPPQTLSVTASGGLGAYTYQWYENTVNNSTTGSIILGETNNAYIPLTTTVGTKYYYCEIKNSTGVNCSVTSDVATVIVNPEPTFMSQPASATVCAGSTPTPLSVTYNDGAGDPTYQWFSNTINDNTTGTPIVSATNSTYSPSTVAIGTLYYYCVVTLSPGGCSVLVSNVAQITVDPVPVISAFNTQICNGTAFSVTPQDITDGNVPVGTTYTWSMPLISPVGAVIGASAQSIAQSTISQTLTNTTTSTATATYVVTPLSGTCPGNDFNVVVTVDPTIVPTVSVQNISCFGVVDGALSASVTGGVPPYSLSWTGPGGFTSNAASISGLYPGDYTLAVTDSKGCPSTNTYTVIEPAEIKITTDIQTDETFFGVDNAIIHITISGGTPPYSYSWTKDGLAYATTEDLDNIAPGFYEVTVSDAHSCAPKYAFYDVTVPPELIVSLISKTDINCFGDTNGAISVDVVGGTPVQITPGVFGYLYSWTGPNGFTSKTKDLTNLAAGTYILNVTDNSGFSKQLTVIITQSSAIDITLNTVPKLDCAAKVVSEITTASVSGGNPPYKLVWSRGTVSGSNNEIMESSQAGSVTLQVTDAIGCVVDSTFNVAISPVGIGSKVLDCDKHSYQFDALVLDPLATYTYLWNFGDGVTDTNKTINHSFTTAGNKTVQLTISSSTCTIGFTQQITVEAPPVLMLDKDPKVCIGDSTIIHVSGADTYRWDDNSVADSIMLNRTGEYSVTGTSKSGCTAVLKFMVSNFDLFKYTIQSDKNQISTMNSTVRFWSESIPSTEYSWDFGDGKSGQGNNLDHIYNITTEKNFDVKLKVINPNGCVENATKRILVVNSSMYNTFSPNGDGIDDVFMKTWHIKVYNRNGILIHDGFDGWDGTYNGKPVSNDTYFFVVFYTTESGAKTNSGYVTVVR